MESSETDRDGEGGPLVGALGIEFVASTLTTMQPQQAIAVIQQRGGLQDPSCPPLLGLLDQLGCTRLEAHRYMLEGAKKMLLKHTNSMTKQEQLVKVLVASFPYLGIPELKDIPISIMEKLDQVPVQFLKQLTEDAAVIKDLPKKVQQQVWESDKLLLHTHAISLVASFKYEGSTVLQTLRMDGALRAQQHHSTSASVHGRVQASRKILRRGSNAIKNLRDMVGGSPAIYMEIVKLCQLKYRDSESLYVGPKESSYCTLRSQLLMALHDDNNEVKKSDACFSLTWTLDACLAAGRVGEDHKAELMRLCQEYQRRTCKYEEQDRSFRRSRLVGDDDMEEGEGSQGAVRHREQKVLGDMGMILRDPPVMHLIVAAVVQQVHVCVNKRQLPSASADLTFFLKLLQLAVQCRQMMRKNDFFFPEVDELLLRSFLPRLGEVLLFPELEEVPNIEDADVEDFFSTPDAQGHLPHRELQGFLERDEIARKVVQMFVLERLAAGDLVTSKILMMMLKETLTELALPEYAPFAASLAQAVSNLVHAGRITPGSSMWSVLIDEYLVQVVDAHPQVHEEVLRVLLEASSGERPGARLPAKRLGQYLGVLLEKTKRSRRKARKKALDPDDYVLPAGYSGEDEGPSGTPQDVGSWSDGFAGVLAMKMRTADCLRATYQRIMKEVPELATLDLPEILREYLDKAT